MNPSLSVIMAAYNAENTIERAVKSVIDQTFPDWELIIVNDGSKDGTESVLRKLISTDDRLRLFTQENAGVAMTRKLGISKARGKYLIHLDADDWVEPTWLEKLISAAVSTGADVIIGDYVVRIETPKKKYISQNIENSNPQEILLNILEGKLFGGLWNKLIKTEIYRNYNVKFWDDINYREDVLALTQILINPEVKCVHVDNYGYNYNVKISDCNNRVDINKKNMKVDERFFEELEKILKDRPLYKNYLDKIPEKLFLSSYFRNAESISELKQKFKPIKTRMYRNHGLRWRIGFFLMELGFLNLSRKFIKLG